MCVCKTVGVYAIFFLYVDDILISCSNINNIKDMKYLLSKNFHMKDLGPKMLLWVLSFKKRWLHYFNSISLCRETLKKFNYFDSVLTSYD